MIRPIFLFYLLPSPYFTSSFSFFLTFFNFLEPIRFPSLPNLKKKQFRVIFDDSTHFLVLLTSFPLLSSCGCAHSDCVLFFVFFFLLFHFFSSEKKITRVDKYSHRRGFTIFFILFLLGFFFFFGFFFLDSFVSFVFQGGRFQGQFQGGL